MFRTVGYVFLVLLIGTFAIAWSQHESTVKRAETLTPDNMHVTAQPIPVQEANDMTFIYVNEK